MDDHRTWAETELQFLDLEHAARTKRAVQMLAQLAATPAGTVAATFPDAAARTGAYRFLESDRFSGDALDAGLHAACAWRCRGHALVIVPIDGSSLAHTDRLLDDGVGPIGTHSAGARGLKSMIALAMTVDGVPLGIAAHVLWARSDAPLAPHHARPLAQRESRWWCELQRAFERELAAADAHTLPWYQMDREADASHVLLRDLESDARFTVRVDAARVLAPEPDREAERARRTLRTALDTPTPAAVTYLETARGSRRTARLARCEVRFARVPLRLCARWSKRRLGDVTLTAVWVREVGTAPSEAEALEWMLLTNAPVGDVGEALRVVRAYGLRFRIERVHFNWKSGTCHVEQAQLESFEALRRWGTLHLSVAIHREHLLQLSRTEPERPADEVFERPTIEAALTLAQAEQPKAPKPGTTPTLGVMVDVIAKLGGYTGKASAGGPPGAKTFARGMERVEIAASVIRLLRPPRGEPTPDDRTD
jgi:hypothetical protein